MKFGLIGRAGIVTVIVFAFQFISVPLRAQVTPTPTASASSIPESQLLKPEALIEMLKATEGEKPLVLQVGSYKLFAYGHIIGAEYAGPGSQPAGLQQLQDRVSSLPRSKFIVLYCGCCPWDHCPNLGPAFAKLREMGFTNVKALYLPHNFGTDWEFKGYPAVRGN